MPIRADGGRGRGDPIPRKKKEADEVKLTPLPKHASQYQRWADTTVDNITSASIDPELAFDFFRLFDAEGASFEQFADIPEEHATLDAKIRTKISVLAENDKANPDLVAYLTKQRDILRRGVNPRPIKGMQLLYSVWEFFQIGVGERMQGELHSLIDLKYAGDDKAESWKNTWDYMLRHRKQNLDEETKRCMF